MTTTAKRARYITHLGQVGNLSASEREQLEPVAEKFAFRTNNYYQGLIDWNDPKDPIRQLVIPNVQELTVFGEWDASDEASYTVADGLEHKYRDAALLLVNKVCGAYCRFCFRKRLFTQDNDEVVNDVSKALAYIRVHPEINNVLLSGGDPLVLSTRRLEEIIRKLREIDHVKIIRIGSKMPAFDPYRIINDPDLVDMLGRYSKSEKKIFLMSHFNHPRELTDLALQGMAMMQRAGVATVSQSPLIRGVNDDADVISELFNRLSFNGILPYYLFICRPTAGNDPFMIPIESSLEIFERARVNISGLAKQARLCMSHKTGKIEVVGRIGSQIAFRYHRAVDERDRNRLMLFESDPTARWLDDYLSGDRIAVDRALEATGSSPGSSLPPAQAASP
jgi:lysine 2,3-aminomutase